MPDTAFSAPIHGFPFPNHFSVQLPVTYALPYGGAIDLNQVCAGLGGGMCFAALDFFYAGQPVPGGTDVAAIDPALLTYLSERQLDSLPVATVLKIVAWTLLEPAERERRMNRYEIPRLRRSLERGKPAVLALLHSSGLENPAPVSMVVATGYREGSDEERVVLLYDPAHPGEAVELRPGRQSSGEAVAGWFTLPYRRQRRIPVEQPRRVTFAREVGLPFYLAWPVDSRRLNQGFGENPDSYKPFGLPGHEGLDLYALPGANIYAPTAKSPRLSFPRTTPTGCRCASGISRTARSFTPFTRTSPKRWCARASG
jgi:hypothetical protein